MKKQTSLQLQPAALSAINVWLNRDNSLFSTLFESAVSNRQALLMGNTCLSFLILVCTALSPMVDLVMLLWFIWSLDLCRKGGIR